jgi:hypothetical protein
MKDAEMERYANLSGDSGVALYEIGSDSIRIQFSEGSVYLYTCSSAGAGNIERMKKLASAGRGLSSFIATTVKKRYARKER